MYKGQLGVNSPNHLAQSKQNMKPQQPSENPQTPTFRPTTPTDRFFAAAAIGQTQWWRWILGTIAVVGILLGVVLAVSQACKSSALELLCYNETYGVSVFLEFLLRYLPYVGALVGMWFVARLLHKKTLTQVTTGRASFDYSRVLYAAFAGLCVAIVVSLLYRLIPGVESAFQDQSLQEYLPLIPAVLIFVSIQSGTEEVFFRGYLLQGLSLLTRNRLVLALVTAILFTAPHLLTNPDRGVIEFTLLTLWLMPPGILLAVLTLLDGGVELAVGYHAIHNAFNGLIANVELGGASSSSLFAVYPDEAGLIPVYFVDAFGLVLALLILNLKYKWFPYPWSKTERKS